MERDSLGAMNKRPFHPTNYGLRNLLALETAAREMKRERESAGKRRGMAAPQLHGATSMPPRVCDLICSNAEWDWAMVHNSQSQSEQLACNATSNELH